MECNANNCLGTWHEACRNNGPLRGHERDADEYFLQCRCGYRKRYGLMFHNASMVRSDLTGWSNKAWYALRNTRKCRNTMRRGPSSGICESCEFSAHDSYSVR